MRCRGVEGRNSSKVITEIGKSELIAAMADYLIRPDQHIAARWPTFDASAIHEAIARATGITPSA